LGAFNLAYSPGWAIGGFFVPFLNLARPFQVVREIWKASDPEDYSWQLSPTSPLIGGWGVLVLASNFLGRMVAQFARGAETSLAGLSNFTKAMMFDDAFGAVAAIPAIVLILSIDKRQEQKHERLMTQGQIPSNPTM
jgi:hypothetical protein